MYMRVKRECSSQATIERKKERKKETNKEKKFTRTPCLLSGCRFPNAPVGPHSQNGQEFENGLGIGILKI